MSKGKRGGRVGGDDWRRWQGNLAEGIETTKVGGKMKRNSKTSDEEGKMKKGDLPRVNLLATGRNEEEEEGK